MTNNDARTTCFITEIQKTIPNFNIEFMRVIGLNMIINISWVIILIFGHI